MWLLMYPCRLISYFVFVCLVIISLTTLYLQTQLMKLPKNLLAKTPTIKNTGQMLELMPRVISSLDAHIDSGLQSVPHLKTVTQLLENMESCQLSSLSQAQLTQVESQQANQHPEIGSPP
ncbi:hypothetical protein DITRI_Ditri07aG0165800 [Diplodiscus trichospermus]